MNIKQHIPNAITLLNLLSGCLAVLFAVNSNFVLAAFFVFLGIFFDFFDGFLARKLKVSSEIGLQLDSLADMVTSGLVPGIVMFKLLTLSISDPLVETVTNDWNATIHLNGFKASILPLFGLCITLASAYRLAKFNVDIEQQSYFKGLPTPANALLILSLPLIIEFQNSDTINTIILNPWFLVVLTIFSCYILNANVKLFALKFEHYKFSGNAIRYTFLLLSVVLLVLFKYAGLPLVIVTYILLSLVSKD